jgi:hypothetical protein
MWSSPTILGPAHEDRYSLPNSGRQSGVCRLRVPAGGRGGRVRAAGDVRHGTARCSPSRVRRADLLDGHAAPRARGQHPARVCIRGGLLFRSRPRSRLDPDRYAIASARPGSVPTSRHGPELAGGDSATGLRLHPARQPSRSSRARDNRGETAGHQTNPDAGRFVHYG